MRLSEFILSDMEPILQEWEAFAATLTPAADGMSSLALRDHAEQILRAVAHDIETSQTRQEQAQKSKGRAPDDLGGPETAAETHAVLRARSGFEVTQLVAEYRALRASVLRLWLDARHEADIDPPDAQQVIRFNEAIDQAVAESVSHYHDEVEKARSLFLGMLGHDLRNPLDAILGTAAYLSALNAGEHVSRAAERLIRSGESMRALLDDLVDYNRARFGLGIRVQPEEIDLGTVVTRELEQLRDAFHEEQIELEVVGDTRGRWDGARLQQVLRNLVSNAVRHGTPGEPVYVRLTGEADQVRLEVRNRGSIDLSDFERLFDPLRQGDRRPEVGDEGSNGSSDDGLGLGLFIVRVLTEAHAGEIEVACAGGETTFAIRLPREGAA